MAEKEPLQELYEMVDGDRFDAELHVLGVLVQAINRHIKCDIEAQRRIANWLSSKVASMRTVSE